MDVMVVYGEGLFEFDNPERTRKVGAACCPSLLLLPLCAVGLFRMWETKTAVPEISAAALCLSRSTQPLGAVE